MAKSASEHITPLKIYIFAAAFLFLMTGVTVLVSFIPLGGWNAVVAVGIATIKALAVVLIFMHLYYDSRLNSLVFSIGLIFVALFISLTLFDTLRRADLYGERSMPVQPRAKIYTDSPDQPGNQEHDPD